MEKLMKAFESLKSFQQQQGLPLAEELVQKQSVWSDCEPLSLAPYGSGIRTSPEFQKLLGIAMEMFLLCSDDRESDVRMVADECLNKIIKALMDSNLPRLQLELYKEIKKNGASRSLRASLWRFAELSHLVRPQKCRPYLVNLLPCLTRISKRPEESVQETLAAAIPKIMAPFGNFANDGEIKSEICTDCVRETGKPVCITAMQQQQCYASSSLHASSSRNDVGVGLITAILPSLPLSPSLSALKRAAGFPDRQVLLKAFMANLKSSSPTIRRTAASSVVSICQHSRRTHYFYTWLLNVLLGLLVPVDDEHPSPLILGVLLTLRYLMPLLQQQVKDTSLKGSFGVTRKEADIAPTPEQLIQVQCPSHQFTLIHGLENDKRRKEGSEERKERRQLLDRMKSSVYELTLHYTQHHDHNVVTAALELLQQTFRTPPPDLLHTLITPGSIPRASITREDVESRGRSGSILELIAGGGSSCSPLLLRKQKGKLLSGEEEGLEDDLEARSEVTTGNFTASVTSEATSEAPSSSTLDATGAAPTHDIITEQPRSSQRSLQPGDSVDLSASSEQGEEEEGDGDEEDMLSRSSSQATNHQALSPASDNSSQTTTEGPDSAVTPSDCSELVSLPRRSEPPPSPTSTEGPDASPSSDFESSATSSTTSTSSSSYSTASFASSSDKVSSCQGERGLEEALPPRAPPLLHQPNPGSSPATLHIGSCIHNVSQSWRFDLGSASCPWVQKSTMLLLAPRLEDGPLSLRFA
ncbi:hypothetical protein JZ751_005889 [Albula glossodonta]|uniref:Huntingtin n=1 Tax=Albula glossodonta TaxID=121402 RepID=A0A8T2PBF4_9TELE|nr:hypothetical protein JZ751_005889 [Albula glossodonta]